MISPNVLGLHILVNKGKIKSGYDIKAAENFEYDGTKPSVPELDADVAALAGISSIPETKKDTSSDDSDEDEADTEKHKPMPIKAFGAGAVSTAASLGSIFDVSPAPKSRNSDIYGALEFMTEKSSAESKAFSVSDMNKKREQIDRINATVKVLEADGVPYAMPSEVKLDKNLDELTAIADSLDNCAIRANYNVLSEELLTCGCKILENVFNGKNKIPFIGISPDLTDYSATARAKFRMMRHDFHSLMEDVIPKKTSPLTRIALCFLPSMVIHASSRSKKRDDLDGDVVRRTNAEIHNIEQDREDALKELQKLK